MASILRRGTCLSSCDGMVQLKWRMKDSLPLFSMCCIYTEHKWISKKKTVEKKSSRSWRLFVKSMCFGAQCSSSGCVSTSFCVGKWNWKMKSKGSQGFHFPTVFTVNKWTGDLSTWQLLPHISNWGFDNKDIGSECSEYIWAAKQGERIEQFCLKIKSNHL